MRNEIKRTILFDFKRVIFSWQLYTAIVIILLGAIITYSRNFYIKNLCNLTFIGTINTFIYSNIVGNNIIVLLAPVIASMVYCGNYIEDMKTGLYKQIAARVTPIKYLISKIASAIIWGGGVFLLSYLLIFIAIAILDPAASVRTQLNRESLFGLIYDRSMLLFCFAFVGYTFFFGATYSLVSLGIAMISKNIYLAMGFPFFIYYTSR